VNIPRFAGCDCSVTIELRFEDPIGIVKWLLNQGSHALVEGMVEALVVGGSHFGGGHFAGGGGHFGGGRPVPIKGYWSTIDILEGDDWKIEMLIYNLTPAH
jgi:hypothetical protein